MGKGEGLEGADWEQIGSRAIRSCDTHTHTHTHLLEGVDAGLDACLHGLDLFAHHQRVRLEQEVQLVPPRLHRPHIHAGPDHRPAVSAASDPTHRSRRFLPSMRGNTSCMPAFSADSAACVALTAPISSTVCGRALRASLPRSTNASMEATSRVMDYGERVEGHEVIGTGGRFH